MRVDHVPGFGHIYRDRCVTSVNLKLSPGCHLSSECHSRDYSSFLVIRHFFQKWFQL